MKDNPTQQLLKFCFAMMVIFSLVQSRRCGMEVDGEAGLKAAEAARIEECEREGIAPCPTLKRISSEQLQSNLGDFVEAKESAHRGEGR